MYYSGVCLSNKYRQRFIDGDKSIVLELVRQDGYWEFSKLYIHPDLTDSGIVEIMFKNINKWAHKHKYKILSPSGDSFDGISFVYNT